LQTWGFCSLAQTKGCTSDCPCTLLSKLIPDAEAEYEACWNAGYDRCGCYTSAVAYVAPYKGICGDFGSFTLTSCIRSQFNCTDWIGTDKCAVTSVSLDISEIKEMFEQYQSYFVDLWNKNLEKLQNSVSVTAVVTTTNGDKSITWQLSVSYDDSKVTLDGVIEVMKGQLAASVGLKKEQLSGGTVESNGGKRNVLGQTTSDIFIQGTSTDGSGASTLSFVILPIVSLISFFHYLF